LAQYTTSTTCAHAIRIEKPEMEQKAYTVLTFTHYTRLHAIKQWHKCTSETRTKTKQAETSRQTNNYIAG